MGPTFEPRQAQTSGGRIAYVDEGDGEPLVLLHGFPTSSVMWRREIELFASRMRVIAPDLIGYGASDKPVDADLTIAAQARYVRELLDGLRIDRAALIGHDVGGGVAQLLALDLATAGALVLLDTICFDMWPVEAVRLLQATTPEQETADFAEGVVRLALETGLEHGDRLTEDDVEAFVAPWRSDPPALFRAARALDGVGLAGREDGFAALEVPAFVIWGEDDAFVSSGYAEPLGDALPGSMVALLPGCGHWVNIDAPTTVGPLILGWLRNQYLHETHQHASGGPVPVFLERPPTALELQLTADDDDDDAPGDADPS